MRAAGANILVKLKKKKSFLEFFMAKNRVKYSGWNKDRSEKLSSIYTKVVQV